MTYQDLLNKLIEGENFSFARYGDGEFNAILGASKGQQAKHNCDGHRYFKDMGLRLLSILHSKPKYIMGLQGLVQRTRKDDTQFHKLIEGIDWVDSDIIHRASMKGNALYGLLEALGDKDIILVSKDGLQSMLGWWPYAIHISVNEKDCWLQYDEIITRIRGNIAPNVVILYCAGMPAEVFIDDIYNEFKNVTQIDIGSAFDPYCNLNIRSYHKDVIDKL